MFKTKLFIGILLISLLGCNDDEPRKSVLGAWNCQEFPEFTSPRTYSLNIERNPYMPNSTNQYAIRNFYKLGNGDENLVFFEQKNDTLLVIPSQTTQSGTSINSGIGIIQGTFEEILWEYKVTSGIGQENCRATYY